MAQLSGFTLARRASEFHATFQSFASGNTHSCVAFLPCARLILKALKPKEPDLEPETLGEHVKRRRLELKLTQRQTAYQLQVSALTVLAWEKAKAEPCVESIPAILGFLGYDPFPVPETVPERLFTFRRQRGWSIRQAAGHLRVDPTTWRDWERGELILFRKRRKPSPHSCVSTNRK
jgi:transcriptional regulator with XRE-family HTH domain